MPRISKVRKASSKPGNAKPVEERAGGYVCSRCGKVFRKQKGNFPASQSPLYRGNGGYLTVCSHCLESLFEHYCDALGNAKDAVKRICLKFDIYWNEEIFNTVERSRTNTSNSRIKSYISKTNLIMWVGKTYDDTLDEAVTGLSIADAANAVAALESGAKIPEPEIDPEAVLFWGSGFTPETYQELNLRYDRWTKDVAKPLPKAEEALYKQVCLQEYQINKNAAAGESIERGQNVLNNLLSSLNVKPNQVAKDDEDKGLDATPLGVWARRWEEHRPIPESDIPSSKLITYITTWFFGHLGKAFGLKNTYTRLYEDEMNKFRVIKPEFESEDDDEVMVDIFGNNSGVTVDEEQV